VAGEHITMPNHFHAIVVIVGDDLHGNAETVGVDLRVDPMVRVDPESGGHAGPPRHTTDPDPGGHVGPPLPTIVQWFKTMTTNEYIRGVKQSGWVPFKGKLWQRNYYEHIIRNDQEYERIAKYIECNPLNWEQDNEYLGKMP
jgi:putative transposase